MSGPVAAIVLAAGRGTRFGVEPKMVAALEGKPLVRHAAEAALASACRPVLVVTGHRAADIEHALGDLPVQVVANPRYADGLSTSLRAGFAALPPGARGALILLGDMPRISAGTLDRLASAWLDAGEPVAAIPLHDGRRGNPVLLSAALSDEIAALAGDVGAGPLLRGRAGILEVPFGDPGVTLDIDTPGMLGRLQASTTPSSTAE